jgi:hypothetical protein
VTSYRQIEANRYNALKSTGPKSEAGKQASRRNALRHGLTAETVISALEDRDDYKSFEGAIAADYDAQSAVERELVLRLASLLWRLRRATMMETGLFEIHAERFCGDRQNLRISAHSQNGFSPAAADDVNGGTKSIAAIECARCFLELANLPNLALDRLNRYEATLWRQARRTIYALEMLDRRKPQERSRPGWPFGMNRTINYDPARFKSE